MITILHMLFKILKSIKFATIFIITATTIIGNGIKGTIVASIFEKNDLSFIKSYYLSSDLTVVGELSDEYDNITELNNEQFILQESFEGFDFDNVWEIKNEGAYPTLKGMPYIFFKIASQFPKCIVDILLYSLLF